jgi:putative proteasome-type protease
MTYCVAVCLNEGLVFLSDTRTNAGVDDIGTFRKMTIYQKDSDRIFTLLSAGNLAITQSVKEILIQGIEFNGQNLWSVTNCYDAALIVGLAIRKIRQRDEKALEETGVEFNCSFIFGGQIAGEKPRLFTIYSAGNFVESTLETCYFQIGEAKYGKPILDRVINFNTPIELATKCALISMDSTLKSNISVGLPLDLFVYQADSFKIDKAITIDDSNMYFSMIRKLWGQKLTEIVMSIQDPNWDNHTDSLSIACSPVKLGPIPLVEN